MVLTQAQVAAIEAVVAGWEPDEPKSWPVMVGTLVEAIEQAEEAENED
jgi:hypothetical protein